MSNSTCSLSIDTLLSLGIPSTDNSSYYACSTASNYTRFSTCCAPNEPHAFSDNACYSRCDLPTSLNARFDASTGLDDDAYSYMKDCLEQDGNTTVEVLYCSAKPHVIEDGSDLGSTPTGTDEAFPASTSDYCAGSWPPQQSSLASLFDPDPGCAVSTNASNLHSFQECCSPSSVELDTMDCYAYCLLPFGDGSQPNLTVDQALGSFKACMIKDGNGLDNRTLFGGMYCRANKSAVNLSNEDFGAQAYLPPSRAAHILDFQSWMTALPMVAAFFGLIALL